MVSPCPCLGGVALFICYTCSGEIGCQACNLKHDKHSLVYLEQIKASTGGLISTIERSREIVSGARAEVNSQQRLDLLREVDEAEKHFNGILADEIELEQTALAITMGQLSVDKGYQYGRLLQLLLEKSKMQAVSLKVDSEFIVLHKKLELTLAKCGPNFRGEQVIFTPAEQNVLRLRQQYLRYQGSVKMPPKSSCSRCQVNCCARYKACVYMASHYLLCKCCGKQNRANEAIRAGEGCSFAKCRQYTFCCPCMATRNCMCPGNGFYCDDPLLLFCCCNGQCECLLCDLDHHPCPCCMCVDACCQAICSCCSCCDDPSCDCCEKCCDLCDYCCCSCECVDSDCCCCLVCDAFCNCFENCCDCVCTPFCNCLQNCCGCFCEPLCDCLGNSCDACCNACDSCCGICCD